MVLMNKAVLSSFQFSCPTVLLLLQCSVCGLAAWMFGVTESAVRPTDVQLPVPANSRNANLRRWRQIEPLTWPLFRIWIPVNALFVAMVWTSFASLTALGVPMVTVLKNLTNLFIIGGDYLFFGRKYGLSVWASLALITVSALCSAATDLSFTYNGYAWQLTNCLATAAYSLTLRAAMDNAVKHTKNNKVRPWQAGYGSTV